MDERAIGELFSQLGLLVEGHFILSSGGHSNHFINKNALYPHIKETKTLCREMALRAKHLNPDVVVGPATGGIILSQWIAYHLIIELEREILAVYAEKMPGRIRYGFKRGYGRLLKGKSVFMVDDVITTGLAVMDVVHAVRDCGGEVVGAGVLCNRANIQQKDLGDVPMFFSLLEIPLSSWDANKCPLCRNGVSFNTDLGRAR